MRLACPSCNAPADAADVDASTGLARCRYCGAAFRVTEASAPERLRPDAPRPASITVDQQGNRLTFRHRWFSWKFIFLTVFCIFWNGFLIVWYSLALAGDAPLLFKLFPILHVAVGVGMAYYTVAGYLNTTTVQWDRDYLSVRHGPVPWPGNRELSTTGLRQLYCKERVARGKNGVSITYSLHALMKDGDEVKLLSGLDSADVPRYLEQQLERFLKIPDAAVAGELAR